MPTKQSRGAHTAASHPARASARPSRARVLASGALLALLLPACTSIQSTRIGDPRCGQCYDGIPILVSKNRYLKVTTRVSTYRFCQAKEDDCEGQHATKAAPEQAAGGASGGAGGTVVSGATSGAKGASGIPVGTLSAPETFREVEFEFLKIAELYAVDLKRPFAGSITGAEFHFPNADHGDPAVFQYPTQLGATVDDQTLQQVREKVPGIFKMLGLGDRPEAARLSAGLVPTGSRIVSVVIYDLDDASAPPLRLQLPNSAPN